MKKSFILLVLFLSGVAISLAYGLMLLMRKVSLYQMNHVKAAH
jgi:hypothetical protein